MANQLDQASRARPGARQRGTTRAWTQAITVIAYIIYRKSVGYFDCNCYLPHPFAILVKFGVVWRYLELSDGTLPKQIKN